MRGIEIKGLFGRFDYKIKLAEGGITILTGPNGFGKSTILRCIKAIADSDIDYLIKLEFEEIRVFADHESDDLRIKKIDDEIYVNEIKISRDTYYKWKKGDFLVTAHKISPDDGDHNQIYINNILESPGGQSKGTERGGQFKSYFSDKISDIIRMMKKSITGGAVKYIEEQRLIREESPDFRTRAGYRRVERHIVQAEEEIPRQLRIKMSEVATRYSSTSNKLDSTFPQRLFQEQKGISQEEFDQKLKSMQSRVEKLRQYDITDISKIEAICFKQEDARALKVYFEDFDKKYEEYQELIDKLDMFTRMINDRFLFKQIQISNDKGITVYDKENKKEIALSQLSSGEKETIVLFYKLLFEVPEGAVLLLDEPEISLHIAWQRMFADDLKLIVERKKMTAIIATHSAQIVNGRRNIQVDLGELYRNGLDKK